MSEKVNAKLYKIQDLIVQDRRDPEKLITEIVSIYRSKTSHSFIEVPLIESIINNKTNNEYAAKLFIYNTKAKEPEWQNFLSTIVAQKEEISKLENKYSSFVLFVYNRDNIFAITKGYYGHHLLNEYIDAFFGLEILSKLIDKSTTEIKQIEERALFGIEVGAQRFFRDNYNLALDDDFGKIYKAMLASIEEEDFKKLGIVKKKSSTVKVSITGSSSFEVSTNFSYKELVDRIKNINTLLLTEGVEFNQFYRLTSLQLSLIKDELNDKILKMAYTEFSKKNKLDFYHPNIMNYLRSSEVRFRKNDVIKEILFSSSVNYIDLINLIGKDIIDTTSEETFIESLKNSSGAYKINDDGNFVYEATLDNWINGEVELNNKKYFKIDNLWYSYRESFDGYLNKYFKNVDFDNMKPAIPLKTWDTKKYTSEGIYNDSFRIEKNLCFFEGDRSYMNYIEVADLIKITDDEILLYHIKKGLGQDLRVLSSQIINAARYLKNAIDENDSLMLKKYYKSISEKHYSKKTINYLNEDSKKIDLNESKFIELFKKSKIKFVFAYASKSKKTINDEVISTDSRIAKLSLIYTIRDMQRTGFDFLIERIKLI